MSYLSEVGKLAKPTSLTSNLKKSANRYRRYATMALLYIGSFLSLSVGPLAGTAFAAATTAPTVTDPAAATSVSATTYTVKGGHVSGSVTMNFYNDVNNNGSIDVGDTVVATGTATGSTYSISVPLSAGANNFLVTATKSPSTESVPVDVPTITSDTQAPNTPTASPVAGSYNSTQNVTLSSTDNGASGLKAIYYTVDGSTPTTASAQYTSSISVSSSETIKAIAVDNAGNTSSVGTFAYIIDTVAPDTPTAAPVAGSYNSAQMVSLSSSDTGGSGLKAIYYTTDGSTPTSASTQYTTPVLVASSETLKAIAYDNAGNFSAVGTYPYVIDSVAPDTPTASPVAGTYNTTQMVTLSSSDSGGSGLKNIYYTTDGSTPTNASTVYSSAISVSSNETIKAIAYDNAGNSSAVGTFTYVIDTVAPADPTATPGSGDYNSSQTVTLSSSDDNSGVAAIYYTTNGSTPNSSSTLYTAPILISSSTTLKTIAYDNAGNPSNVATYTYVIDTIAPTTPSASPGAGSYNSNQSVTLSSTDSGGSGLKEIRYTTDGSTPNNSSTLYTSAISVSSSETIKAIAYDNAGNASSVGTYAYVIDKVAPTDPLASPSAGSYNSTQMVSLSSTDSGGSGLSAIYYTTDGSIPSNSSTVYTTPITVASSETIKAIAYDGAGNASGVASFTYIIDSTAPTTPTAAPGSGLYNSTQNVTLSSSDSGGSGLKDIYYTTDGSTPDNTSAVYSGPINVSANETIKAIAYDNAGNSSSVATFTYVIDTVAPSTPVATPSSGSYNSSQNVTLSSNDNSGGSGLNAIYYTTDGSTPDNTSTKYTAPVSITAGTTLKAIAYDNAGNTSTVATYTYVIDTVAPSQPVATPGSGTYTSSQIVSISSSDNAGGSGLQAIYYTTDGSVPTNASTLYTGPITISSNTVLRAVAYDNVGNVSTMMTDVYAITQPSGSGGNSGGGGSSSNSSSAGTGSTSTAGSTGGTGGGVLAFLGGNGGEVLGASTDDQTSGGQTLGTSTNKLSTPQKELVTQAKATHKATKWLGLTWYWWLLIVAFVLGLLAYLNNRVNSNSTSR